jgi:pimeloyl-ACP methyl ester carboxylesterase
MQSSPFTETYWTSPDGLRLYTRVYEVEAAGAATVLCLHGLTRNSRDFEDLAPHLQHRYRVIVPDLRGRGLSARDTNPQNYQPAIYVQDILALMDVVAAAQVTVIGTSLGGLLAMMLGVGFERIKGYAGRLPPPKDWSDAITQTRTMFADAWPNLSEQRWSTIVRRGFREKASGAIRVDADPMIGEMLRAAPAATANLWPFWNVLRGIPMLAIRGERSDILSAATFARMKAENPDLMQLEVAQRGHVPLLDEPECMAAIDAFLARAC